VITIVLEDY